MVTTLNCFVPHFSTFMDKRHLDTCLAVVTSLIIFIRALKSVGFSKKSSVKFTKHELLKNAKHIANYDCVFFKHDLLL